jgi:alpha-amylase/alpha-mannosidase (GH57 family)
MGSRHWRDVNGGRIDPTRPYAARLPSGKKLALFFYDAPVSQAVAFEKLLMAGEKFADRLMSAFSDRRGSDQLVHIATDGESYGHHHRHGEMALAYALQHIEGNQLARLTNYGEYLANHPPTHEAQIHERSAWSCPHGLGRWMENCGCNSGGHGGWNQHWRAPLRHALDWLRDQLGPLFDERARRFVKDPWEARDDYIAVVLDRGVENRRDYFRRQALRDLSEPEEVTVLKLMELQRHAMLMYTSCGWFFDELSGIETVQVIQYAGRAIQLAGELFGRNLEPEFLNRLQQARSNLSEHGDGRRIYEKFVKPAMVDWEKVVAHYAISSLFQSYNSEAHIYLFEFHEEHRQVFTAGRARLCVGRTRVTFEITRESAVLSYAVLYMGEHHLTGGVRVYRGPDAFQAMTNQLKESFDRADFPETIRLIDRHCGESNYSLKSMFKDEQRKVLNEILSSTREDLEGRYRLITERYIPLMRFLRDLGAPLPSALQTAADFILNVDISRELQAEETNVARLEENLEEARSRGVPLERDILSYVVKNKLERMLQRLTVNPDDPAQLGQLEAYARVVQAMPLDLSLWKVQNLFYALTQTTLPARLEQAAAGDETARLWVEHFRALGQLLGFGRGPLRMS